MPKNSTQRNIFFIRRDLYRQVLDILVNGHLAKAILTRRAIDYSIKKLLGICQFTGKPATVLMVVFWEDFPRSVKDESRAVVGVYLILVIHVLLMVCYY